MGVMSFSAEPVPHVIELLSKHYKGGSVLDFGCGTGRYTDIFDEDGYLGVDGFPGNISWCEANWTEREWLLADLETWKPDKKFDYLFSSVSMEQLENLPMGWAQTYLLVEPIGFKHDYVGIYKPQEVVEIKDAEDVLKFMVAK